MSDGSEVGNGTVADALIRKLEHHGRLSEEERATITGALCGVRRHRARDDVIREGDPTTGAHVVLEGFACRYKLLDDGRRQIVAYAGPGDFCDPRGFVLERMDYSIATLAPSVIGELPREAVIGITERHPRLSRALWWATLVDESITREWLVGVGQRTAYERLAHLFCELCERLKAVGLTDGSRFALPVTQMELADTVGLSAVHVNRTLQDLRRDGLISLLGGELEILDWERLCRAALFDRAYLHLGDRDKGEAATGGVGHERTRR